MNATSRDIAIVRAACHGVRSAAKLRGGVNGRCTEVSLAAALVAEGTSIPVLLCHGTVMLSGGEVHPHSWLRIGDVVVDATLDQFTSCDDVHVCRESDASTVQYAESFYVTIRLPFITAYLEDLKAPNETNRASRI